MLSVTYLVIADVTSEYGGNLNDHRAVDRPIRVDAILEIISVRYPTNVIRELFVVLCEICGAPAVDGVADVLGGTDEYGEHAEEEDRVPVVETVHQIVIVPYPGLEEVSYRRYHLVHGFRFVLLSSLESEKRRHSEF